MRQFTRSTAGTSLRRRVDLPDRRCFAFFHPAMPEEPLIFVEVALTREVPGLDPGHCWIQSGSRWTRDRATTAVFYSISNCQPGLAGVSFGAFLIKQVAGDLAVGTAGDRGPSSPFRPCRGWSTGTEAAGRARAGWRCCVGRLDSAHMKAGTPIPTRAEATRPRLLSAGGKVFPGGKAILTGRPVDPVARFHLGNGAELHAIHWPGDVSLCVAWRNPPGSWSTITTAWTRSKCQSRGLCDSEGRVRATKAVRALLKG